MPQTCRNLSSTRPIPVVLAPCETAGMSVKVVWTPTALPPVDRIMSPLL